VTPALSPAEQAHAAQEIAAEAAALGTTFIDACPSTVEGPMTRLREVLGQLGISSPTPKDLCDRVGRVRPGGEPDDALTAADVLDAYDKIAGLPLDVVDRASAQEVVRAVLKSEDRTALARLTAVLAAAAQQAARVAPGTRMFLYVGNRKVDLGDGTVVDLSIADVAVGKKSAPDPEEGKKNRIDLLFRNTDGKVEAQAVLDDGSEVPARAGDIEPTMAGFQLGGPDRVFTVNILNDRGLASIFTTLDTITGAPLPVLDLERVVPAAVLNEDGNRAKLVGTADTKPGESQVFADAAYAVRGNTPGGDHAEVNAKADLVDAAKLAATVGTPEDPAQVNLAVSASPCSGDRPAGANPSCSNVLGRDWPEVLRGLTADERARVRPVLNVVTPGYYEGGSVKDPATGQTFPRSTGTGGLETMASGDVHISVMRAGGAVKARGIPLGLAVNRLRVGQPGAPAATMLNVMRANEAELTVASNRFDRTQTAALANAQEDVKVEPARMANVAKAKAALNENLHEVQRVCI
jgi:hypothetical protein